MLHYTNLLEQWDWLKNIWKNISAGSREQSRKTAWGIKVFEEYQAKSGAQYLILYFSWKAEWKEISWDTEQIFQKSQEGREIKLVLKTLYKKGVLGNSQAFS